MMLRGVFGRPRELFSSPPRPILRAGRFLVMWALGGFSPATYVAYEVDGGDEGASVFLGYGPSYVVLLAVWCSLGDAAVRAAATAVLERAPQRCHERTELRDSAAVFVACHEMIVPAHPGPTGESATVRRTRTPRARAGGP